MIIKIFFWVFKLGKYSNKKCQKCLDITFLLFFRNRIKLRIQLRFYFNGIIIKKQSLNFKKYMKGYYREQKLRTERFFKKLPKENYSEQFSEDYRDAYYSFFQNAFHLKDWIINDSRNNITNLKINKFIEQSEPLKILQSVVNGIKHFKIIEKHNKYPDTEFISKKPSEIKYERKDFICMENGDKILSEKGDYLLVESSSRGEIHPKKLAIDVLTEWNKFFLKNNLKGLFKIVP